MERFHTLSTTAHVYAKNRPLFELETVTDNQQGSVHRSNYIGQVNSNSIEEYI